MAGAVDPFVLVLSRDHERIAADLGDGLIHQMFAVSLDLHSALVLINHPDATARVTRAICGLDQAIIDLRGTIFDLRSPPHEQPDPPPEDRLEPSRH
ncbi:MAG: histidine kinase dimerization/phosphoacceptor domain-containing protein [Streptosporangiaceae bacterium]